MGTYLVGWTVDDERTVSTVAELDAALDEYETWHGEVPDVPVSVDIVDADADPDAMPGLTIGLGRERAFVFYSGATADECGYAVDEGVPALPGNLAWDGGGEVDQHEPWRTRLTHERARELAREYVRVGARPAGVVRVRTSQVQARA